MRATPEHDPAHDHLDDDVAEPPRPGPVAWVLLLPIKLYRKAISPFLPPACRFYPSCSAYAVEALTRHGAGRGSYLALRRLLRCGPWTPPGRDPVPETFSWRHRRPETPIEE
ncbi:MULTISPECIES: membrane protein insertion efficiency factor YidD [unclassified Amycolatopsis]|jgi:putative membrane protein insertion efficiency factor|uniref:membrane protein insertion efficiency factor YidD n=1 Tax=unclassified Amycolatopsis TaxID=2618356 RepID=UPI000CD2E264|nr:membrane protein insertion efficiency factor YidD [Amycolatopsis sp. CA-126428]